LSKVDANYSKIAYHAQKYDHVFDFSATSVILIEKNLFKRTVGEAVDKSNYVISQPSHHLDGSWTRALMREEAKHFFSHKSANWEPVTSPRASPD
jgi:hypothetical protein